MSAAALAPLQKPSRFVPPLLVIWQRILQTSAITSDSVIVAIYSSSTFE